MISDSLFTRILYEVEFLWIGRLLCTNLRRCIHQILYSLILRHSDWVLLSECYWFRLVFSASSFGQLCIFGFDQLNQSYDEADFSINSWPWCKELFELELGREVKEITQHGKHILHERIIILRFQVVTTLFYKFRNRLWIDEQGEMYYRQVHTGVAG